MAIIKDIKKLDNLTEVWTKRFQGNNYYPIEKYVWDSVAKKWLCFTLKYNGQTNTYNWCRFACEYTHEGFVYMVTNNAMLLSDTEMFNSDEYNDK